MNGSKIHFKTEFFLFFRKRVTALNYSDKIKLTIYSFLRLQRRMFDFFKLHIEADKICTTNLLLESIKKLNLFCKTMSFTMHRIIETSTMQLKKYELFKSNWNRFSYKSLLWFIRIDDDMPGSKMIKSFPFPSGLLSGTLSLSI